MRYTTLIAGLALVALGFLLAATVSAGEERTLEQRVAELERWKASVEIRLKAVAPPATPPTTQPVAKAETQMVNISNALTLYYAVHRKFPPNLDALTEKDPTSGETYLDSIPKDPWGQPYDYRVSGKKFTILSYGADQMEGTEDDIVWPKGD